MKRSALVAAVVSRGRSNRDRQAVAEAEVKPILFAALDGDEIDPLAIDALDPAQQRALEALARALLPSLRGDDKESLAKLLDQRGAVDAARRRSRSRRAEVRAEAGDFLVDAGAAAGLRDLLDLLDDPSQQVRISAARGLGRLGDPDAVPALLGSVDGGQPVPADVVIDAISQIRDCPVGVLRQGLESPSASIRAVSVDLLGRFQVLASVDEIIDLLHHDPSEDVRARAARCLGRIGTPDTVDPLVACLSAGPVLVRVQAIRALGEIGAPEAVPALRGLLEGSPEMAELAALLLLATGPLGIPVLSRAADDDGRPAAGARRGIASADI